MPKVSDYPHVGKAIVDAIQRGAPDVDLNELPNLQDMSPDKLTENVIAINSLDKNERRKYLLERLVQYMHTYVKEVNLTTDEWMAAIQFLTKTGQTCTDLRQEFILLSDAFGVSALVDTINHPKPPGATESTVLGPFFVEDARTVENGDAIASEDKGEPMLVKGRITDTNGKGIAKCLIETWETDEDGFYDTQYAEYEQDCRGRLYTDDEGYYAFRCVKPVAYPIPNDGPVGQLLRSMGRHVFRPSHLHMMFQAKGFVELITSLYFKGDIFITSDAVFGVKSSLITDPHQVKDKEQAKKYGFKSDQFWLLEKDFVLVTPEENKKQKDINDAELKKSIEKSSLYQRRAEPEQKPEPERAQALKSRL